MLAQYVLARNVSNPKMTQIYHQILRNHVN